MERAWAYASAIATINSGKYHSIDDVKGIGKDRLLNLIVEDNEKKAKHISHGSAELFRRIGVPQPTIHGYLQLLKLEDETQKAIEEDEIPYTYGRTSGV